MASVDSDDRSARYAEAIRSHRVECFTEGGECFGWQCLTCGAESQPVLPSIVVAEQHALAHSAAAVVAVADEEHAALVSRAEAAEAKVKAAYALADIWRASTFMVTDFILARLGERVADADIEENLGHISTADYNRALSECAAMRKIVERSQGWIRDYETYGDDQGAARLADEVLGALASIWSDHPDFDPAWS